MHWFFLVRWSLVNCFDSEYFIKVGNQRHIQAGNFKMYASSCKNDCKKMKTVLNFEFDVQNFKDLNQCIPYMDYSFSSSLACTTKVKQKNPVSIITIMNFSYVYTKYYFFHLMEIYCRALASSHFPSINWKNSKKTAKVFFANQNYSTQDKKFECFYI